MPTTTTITQPQRIGLYELIRDHLAGIGDIAIALEERRDYAGRRATRHRVRRRRAAAGRHRLGLGGGARALRADHAGPRPDRNAQSPAR